MGKAVLDLADPPDTTAASPAPAADDLLSQLAGAEIDKLLAEAEVEMPSAPLAAAPALFGDSVKELESFASGSPATSSQSTSDAAEAGADRETAVAETGAASPAEKREGFAADKGIADEALFANKSAPAENPRIHSSPIPGGAPEAIEPGASTPADATPATLAATAASEHDPSHEHDPQGLACGLFDKLIAPLEACPEPIRDILGKIAVITLFNAVAVLVYVLVFRRK